MSVVDRTIITSKDLFNDLCALLSKLSQDLSSLVPCIASSCGDIKHTKSQSSFSYSASIMCSFFGQEILGLACKQVNKFKEQMWDQKNRRDQLIKFQCHKKSCFFFHLSPNK